MHFLTLTIAVLATAHTSTAFPSEALTSRAVGSIRGTWYLGSTGCNSGLTWGNYLFTEDHPKGECVRVQDAPFDETRFTDRTLTKTLRFYELACSTAAEPGPDPETGRFFDIGPNTPDIPGCRAQAIRSYKVIS